MSRPRILVVDDESTIRALLGDILEDLGYESVAVADGEAAIAALGVPGAAVSLAIVDLHLPGKDGLETLRGLRGLVPALPGILSTGYEESVRSEGLTLRETAAREGFTILEKPYKIDALAAALDRTLGRGRSPT